MRWGAPCAVVSIAVALQCRIAKRMGRVFLNGEARAVVSRKTRASWSGASRAPRSGPHRAGRLPWTVATPATTPPEPPAARRRQGWAFLGHARTRDATRSACGTDRSMHAAIAPTGRRRFTGDSRHLPSNVGRRRAAWAARKVTSRSTRTLCKSRS